MNYALQTPIMSREAFLEWADAREERYEFDGLAPVAMTGGLISHNQILQNMYAALRSRLAGTGCRVLGPDAGVATVGNAVRYPDAVITCSPIPRNSRLVPGATCVFEVLSPGNPGVDHITKVREYWAVSSIVTYVIVEPQSVGLTVLERRTDISWSATVLTGEDVLRLQSPDVAIPVSDFYLDVDLGG